MVIDGKEPTRRRADGPVFLLDLFYKLSPAGLVVLVSHSHDFLGYTRLVKCLGRAVLQFFHEDAETTQGLN